MKFKDRKTFPVNWTNGMKLSSEHFQHLEECVDENVNDARALSLLTLSGYGLLPQGKFMIRNATGQTAQTVRVVLEECQAIMPGGARVEISQSNIKSLQIPKQSPFVEFMPQPNVRYHLFLTISEMAKVGAGIPETRPIRDPYLVHDYHLECIPHQNVASAAGLATNRMKIGEWKDGKILEGYIPPCLTVSSFILLEKWHQFFKNQLENAVKICAHVISENRRKDPARSVFCVQIVQHIRSTFGHYNWMIPNRSPLELIAYFGDVAGLVKGLLESNDRDFVRNVLKNGNVNDLNQNLERFMRMKTVQYDEIANAIALIKAFLDSLMSTLQMLVTRNEINVQGGERNFS